MVTGTSEIQKAVGSDSEKKTSQQGTEETTSKTEPRMLSESEHQKLLDDAVNAAKGELGKKHKIALAEAVKRANDATQTQLIKLQEANQELQTTLEELGEDDEDKSRLTKLLKDNKKKADDLETKLKAYEPKIAKAEDYELTELCNEVAKDYEGADAARLKRIASRTKWTEDEDKIDQIRSLAEDIWVKKQPVVLEKKEEPRKTDSGITTGATKGKTPTLEELRASSPEETEKKIKSGEWIIPAWR